VDLALSAAPRVRWLATSREALGVRGEHVHRLEPLSVPTGPVTAVQAVEHGSIALLCKRVVESDRRFCLDERNVTAAVMLCGQLDGLPLAIEMAATRVATFGLDEVCRRLGHRLKLLKGGAAGSLPRHQTLKATYDWSFELLSDCEQVVFRRLSPFLGGFRVDMAQRVSAMTTRVVRSTHGQRSMPSVRSSTSRWCSAKPTIQGGSTFSRVHGTMPARISKQPARPPPCFNATHGRLPSGSSPCSRMPTA
jgi:predicted ATPase